MIRSPAARAYGASQAALDPRVREADVIRRVSFGLRAAGESGDAVAVVRAVADNRRLWLAIEGAVRHPANGLPEPVRAGLVSVGRAVQREMEALSPDLAFLADINDQVAAGLSGRH